MNKRRRPDKATCVLIAAALLLVILGILVGLLIAVAINSKKEEAAPTYTYRRLHSITLSIPESLQETRTEAHTDSEGEGETRQHLTPTVAASEPLVTPEEITAEPTQEPTAEPTAAPTPEPTEAPTEAPTVAPTPEPTPTPEQWIWVLATAYSDSLNDTPTGCINDLPLTEYWSIAAVLDHLPYGTIVEIEGFGQRRVEDTASAGTINYRLAQIRSDYPQCTTWIDIYMSDPAEVEAFGVRPLRLRIIN